MSDFYIEHNTAILVSDLIYSIDWLTGRSLMIIETGVYNESQSF